MGVLTVGADYSKLFVVVEHCFDEGKAAGSIRPRSLKILIEGNRMKNADQLGVTRSGPAHQVGIGPLLRIRFHDLLSQAPGSVRERAFGTASWVTALPGLELIRPDLVVPE